MIFCFPRDECCDQSIDGYHIIINSKNKIMKKLLFIRTAVLSASLFSYALSFSQSMDTERLASVKLNTSSLSGATAANSVASADEATLMDMRKKNIKMFNHFTTDFPDASNIRLHANKENETLISCMVNGDLKRSTIAKMENCSRASAIMKPKN